MLMTTKQVAEKMSVTSVTVIRWIKDGRLAAINVSTGRRPSWRIDPADLKSFVRSSKTGPIDSTGDKTKIKNRFF